MAAVATMNWADAHFEGIVDGLRAAGAEWGRAHLEWNDLDSGVCVLPTGANGETSIVHCNISLMSDYRIYALSKRTDGVLSLFALKAGSKDFDAMLATVIEGEQSLEPIAVKRGAEVTLMREFDTTEVIDAAGFSTRVVRDLVTGKLDVGAELKTDFDKFRTSYDDDELDSDGDDFEVSVRAPSV
jgi:hypothetical protein